MAYEALSEDGVKIKIPFNTAAALGDVSRPKPDEVSFKLYDITSWH